MLYIYYLDLNVTAYALDPKTIPDNITKRLHRIIQADVLDEEKVEEAIAGHDAVFCAIESYDIFCKSSLFASGLAYLHHHNDSLQCLHSNNSHSST